MIAVLDMVPAATEFVGNIFEALGNEALAPVLALPCTDALLTIEAVDSIDSEEPLEGVGMLDDDPLTLVCVVPDDTTLTLEILEALALTLVDADGDDGHRPTEKGLSDKRETVCVHAAPPVPPVKP
jgi:hypothetical protein